MRILFTSSYDVPVRSMSNILLCTGNKLFVVLKCLHLILLVLYDLVE